MPGRVGQEAVQLKGRLRANRWLLLRRATQLAIVLLFLIGPWFGMWVLKGSLAGSTLLGVVPLTDPFVLAQVLAAGQWPATTALIGAGIVIALYGVLGGRTFCAWVCPMNVVTDAAAWSRRRLGLSQGRAPRKGTRHWLLAAVLVASALAGTAVWEAVNPVTMLQRLLFFGGSAGWLVVAGIFTYDLLVARHGWCGHVCPQGAAYALLGRGALLRVSAAGRGRCNDCGDCLIVCPETHVIAPALKGTGSPVVLAADCTNCGRCVDVCSRNVFRFTTRFDQRSES
jgi:ferredoxin-type protein NapH